MISLVPILLSNVVTACAIAVIATFVGWTGRRAAVAHLLWIAVFVKLITPPIIPAPVMLPSAWLSQVKVAQQLLDTGIGFQSDRQIASHAAGDALSIGPREAGSDDHGPAVARSAAITSSRSALSVGGCLIAIWLAGATVLILRGIARFVRFSNLLRRDAVFDAEASEVVQQLIHGGARGFAPSVCRISARISPMLFGVGRATWIVCPDSLWASLDEEQRRAFLAHEVAHYQRRDHWVRWLEWLVTAIYWWMPLIYWARLQLERHEEAACDAWAIGRLKTSPRSYAETLLSVVDFLSEARTGAPRLASRMQPTAALEERLRLIMQWQRPALYTAKRSIALGACCIGLLAVHPTPLLSHIGLPARVDKTSELAMNDRVAPRDAEAQPETNDAAHVLAELPTEPAGWWNATPGRTWADKVLGENELHLLARVGIGIGVSQPGKSAFTFDAQDVRALAYVAPSGRLLVGTSAGELHLWDAAAHQSVSLLGKHNAPLSSIAFHPSGGLISGDENGTLISWDIGSGQMLATRSFSGPIGSVRWSSEGSELAVLVGHWNSGQQTHRLHLLDAKQLDVEELNDGELESRQSVELPTTIAVVPHDAELGWLAIDWSGSVWSLTDGRVIEALEKRLVSGFVMCQDLYPIASSAGPSSVVPSTAGQSTAGHSTGASNSGMANQLHSP